MNHYTKPATEADVDDDVIDDVVDDAYGDDDVDVDADNVDGWHLIHPQTAHHYHSEHRCHLHLWRLFGSHHFPRGLLFPCSFSFRLFRPFPFRPGVRVELRASQD